MFTEQNGNTFHRQKTQHYLLRGGNTTTSWQKFFFYNYLINQLLLMVKSSITHIAENKVMMKSHTSFNYYYFNRVAFTQQHVETSRYSWTKLFR